MGAVFTLSFVCCCLLLVSFVLSLHLCPSLTLSIYYLLFSCILLFPPLSFSFSFFPSLSVSLSFSYTLYFVLVHSSSLFTLSSFMPCFITYSAHSYSIGIYLTMCMYALNSHLRFLVCFNFLLYSFILCRSVSFS